MHLETTREAENSQQATKKARLSAPQAVKLLTWSAIDVIVPGKPRLLRVSSFNSSEIHVLSGECACLIGFTGLG
ncbi:MAG: hypothetical protein H6921_13795 [Sphingomonas sp.]|nr:hypothetical protein [Sphingomonas sp.]